MAANQKKRQQKLARKTAKRKERQKSLTKQKNRGLADLMATAASAPILDCFVGEEVWDEGMGIVILSRRLPTGEIAFGCFLLDVYCLGVKNAFGNIVSKSAYGDFLDSNKERCELIAEEPSMGRKLVEGAVEYARNLGLEPHADYRRVKPIFGDLDPTACREEFEYGKDGKPFFVAGPHDSLAKCYRIMSILESKLGKDGFHFLIPMLDDDRDLGEDFDLYVE